MRRYETRSSGVEILAKNKFRPALTSPQRPPSDRRTDAHPDASSPRARGTAPRGAARPVRRHSPSSPSLDRQSTSRLRVLNPKLPSNGECSCPSRPGHVGEAGTSEGKRQARRPPRLTSRRERSDNSPTCSANEADRGAEETRLPREGRRGRRVGGAGPASGRPRWVGRAHP